MADLSDLHAALDSLVPEPTPDEDEAWGRILRTYGEAMFFAQAIEVGTVGVACIARWIKTSDSEEITRTSARLRNQTLGNVLSEVQGSPLGDRPFVKHLMRVKEQRNDLAHSYLVMRVPLMLDASRHAAMQEEIEGIRDGFVETLGKFEDWLGGPLLSILSDDETQRIIQVVMESGFDPYDSELV